MYHGDLRPDGGRYSQSISEGRVRTGTRKGATAEKGRERGSWCVRGKDRRVPFGVTAWCTSYLEHRNLSLQIFFFL
jgi:hypothetical protein